MQELERALEQKREKRAWGQEIELTVGFTWSFSVTCEQRRSKG